jgi:integrase
MNLTKLIHEYEHGPWASLRYPERSSARARRVLAFLESHGRPDANISEDFFGPTQLEAMQSEWKLKNSSMNRYIAVLDSMGFKVKYLHVDKDARVRVLSTAQLAQLDANVRADEDEDCQAIYAILRDTGARGLVELQRVSIMDYSHSEKTVTYTSYKGRKGLGSAVTRQVPLSDIANCGMAWLYPHFATKIPKSQWRAFWDRVRLDETNVPYDLRHTFCTRLLDCNVPAPTVMRIMGHSNLAQTLHYQHQRPSALDAARVALQNE